MADEAGGDGGDEAALRHDARLDVVELQAGVVPRHLPCGDGKAVDGRGWTQKHTQEGQKKRKHVSDTNAEGEGADSTGSHFMYKSFI